MVLLFSNHLKTFKLNLETQGFELWQNAVKLGKKSHIYTLIVDENSCE